MAFASLLTFGCREKTTHENPIEEQRQSQTNINKEFIMPVLDSALSPLVALKDYIKVFADTLNVQMYEMTVKPAIPSLSTNIWITLVM